MKSEVTHMFSNHFADIGKMVRIRLSNAAATPSFHAGGIPSFDAGGIRSCSRWLNLRLWVTRPDQDAPVKRTPAGVPDFPHPDTLE